MWLHWPFPGPRMDRAGFLEGCCCVRARWYLQVAGLSDSKSGTCGAKRKARVVPRASASPSPFVFGFSMTSGVFWGAEWKNKKCAFSVFLEAKSHGLFCNGQSKRRKGFQGRGSWVRVEDWQATSCHSGAAPPCTEPAGLVVPQLHPSLETVLHPENQGNGARHPQRAGDDVQGRVEGGGLPAPSAPVGAPVLAEEVLTDRSLPPGRSSEAGVTCWPATCCSSGPCPFQLT